MFVQAATHGSRRRRLGQLALVGALLALAATALVLPLFGKSGEGGASAFSDDPSGHLALVDLAERRGATVSTVLTAPYLVEDVADPASALVLVTRFDRELGDGEVQALVAFVERGGTLVVATSDARGSAIGARWGVDFDGHPVLSSATGTAAGLARPDGTILQVAPVTALHVSPEAEGDATVLLTTARQSFLDLNRDGRIDGFDRDGPFVAGVSIERAEGGRAVFLASSALLENAALESEPVRAFAEGILDGAVAPGSDVVLFEGARTQALQPLATGLGLLEAATRHHVARPVLALGLPLAAIVVAWRYPGPPKLEHVYAGSAERHRDVETARLSAGLRELIVERARERAGLTPVEFERLSATDRRAFIEATIASLVSGSSTEARALAALRLFEEE